MKGPNAAVLLLSCISSNVLAAPTGQAAGVEARNDAVISGSSMERNAPPMKFVGDLMTRDVASGQDIQALQRMVVANPNLFAALYNLPVVGKVLAGVLGGIAKRDMMYGVTQDEVQALSKMVTDVPLVGGLLKGVPVLGPLLNNVLGGLLGDKGGKKGDASSPADVTKLLGTLTGGKGGDVTKLLGSLTGGAGGDVTKLLGSLTGGKGADVSKLLEGVTGKGGDAAKILKDATGGKDKREEAIAAPPTEGLNIPLLNDLLGLLGQKGGSGLVGGLTKSLTGTLDQLTGGATAPVSGTLNEVTDTVDGLLKREEAAEQVLDLGSLLSSLLGTVGSVTGSAGGATGAAGDLGSAVDGLTKGLTTTLDGVTGGATAPLSTTLNGVTDTVDGLLKREEAAEQVLDLGSLLSSLLGTVAGLTGGATGATGGLGSTVGGLTKGLTDTLDGATGGITAPVSDVVDGTTSSLSKRVQVDVSDEQIQALQRYAQEIPLLSSIPIVSELLKTLGL